ncbi:MAG: translation initiation factor IF-3 [Planctomycetota bacterium]
MAVRRVRVNDMIRISPVRVIGPNDEQYGVIETAEAKGLAQDAGLDLVEVSPESRPPVCRIMDYGRYKYLQSKKDKKKSQGGAKTELKEVRLGKSMGIGQHDIEMRVNQARGFLLEGHKVQFVQPFKGREMQHKQLGFERMREIESALSDLAKVEMTPRFNGRRMLMIVAPDKAKIGTKKPKESDNGKAANGKVENRKTADAPAAATEPPAEVVAQGQSDGGGVDQQQQQQQEQQEQQD